jgi:peptide/nickel transport system permease protein
MDHPQIDPLREALALGKAGKRREAAARIARFLAEHPDDARAWHALSYVLTERDQRIYALCRVLAIDPGDRAARAQLVRLSGVAQGAAVPASPAPTPAARLHRPPSISAGEVAARHLVERKRRRPAIRWKVLSSPSLVAGLVIVLVFGLTALAAPLIAPPVDAAAPEIIPRYGYGTLPSAPSAEHPLGLMPKQYDIFYGLIWGARRAFRAGLAVTLARVIVGVVVGLIAGYYGRWLDAALMRVTDAFLSFPVIAAAMVMMALYGVEFYIGPSGVAHLLPAREENIVIAALVLFGWMPYARLLRGNVLAEREKEYIQAARATGSRNRRLILRHLLPNVTQGLFVLVASDIGAVVVLLATFAFIGLFNPPFGFMEADWGQMLSAARGWIIGAGSNVLDYWYTYVPASAAIILFSVGWNLLGDGLRDVLDPRRR